MEQTNAAMLKRFCDYLPPQALKTLQKQLQSSWADDLDHVTLSIALKYCSKDLKFGTQIHGLSISSGLNSYVTVSNSVMNMYCKCGEFSQAYSIFETLPNPDIVSWNTILSGLSESGHAHEFTFKMHTLGVVFDPVSYTTAIAFCSESQELLFGLQLHSLLLKSGFEHEIFVGNSLVSMYSRCGYLEEAKRVFDEMTNRDLISWNAMLSGYTQDGNYTSEAISIFLEMVKEGIPLDRVSLSSVISASGQLGDLELGKQIHGLVLKIGCETHASVSNVLMSMYSKFDLIEYAKLVFENIVERNVISWTTMISIEGPNAVSIFNEMLRHQVSPNEVTFVGLIHAISMQCLQKEGFTIHGICIKSGFSQELNVANCLITMYAKFKSIEDAKRIFDELNLKEIISWNALISGFTENGLFLEALHTFLLLILDSKPTEFTFGSVLSAIASAESISLRYGERCHCHIIKVGLHSEPIISSALVDMYAKRGSIKESQLVFDQASCKNPVVWTAIISAYSRHGNYEHAMYLFRKMDEAGVPADSITFLALLTVCGRSGKVETGCQLFDSMVKDHRIKPSGEHFACMVDILGRAGQLKEAEEFMKRIPGKPGLSTLQSLFWACSVHGNVEMGVRVGEALMERESVDSGVCVSLSNMYADKEEWENVAQIRKWMRERSVKKEVGFSWVDVGDAQGSRQMHAFSSDDRNHQQAEEICRVVEFLTLEMRSLEGEPEDMSNYAEALMEQ